MTSLTLVDAEAAAQAWAEADTTINTLTGSRIFYSVPIAYPKAALAKGDSWILLTLVSETFQSGDLGLQQALIQFDCNGPSKLLAAGVALAVESAARQLTFGHSVTVTPAVIVWAQVSQKRWLPDRTMNIPRYVVDVLFAFHGAEA
jgi:hypothetical protein